MSRDELKDILCQADDAANLIHRPVVSGDLARRVRKRIARRRRRKIHSLALLALALAGFVGIVQRQAAIKPTEVVMKYPGPEKTVNHVDPEKDLQAIRHEIAAHQKVIQKLLVQERLDRAQAALAMAREFSTDRPSLERAAAAKIWQIKQLQQGAAMSRQEAETEYAGIVHSFPNTASAGEARRQLELLKKDGST